MDPVTEIESRYEVPLPAGYRKWVEQRYTDINFSEAFDYLWVHEAEWIPIQDIPNRHERLSSRVSILPGLIPFAFNGAGDDWCFSTQFSTSPGEYEIWFCPHDDQNARPISPTFSGWFYYRCIDFASGQFDKAPEEIENAQQYLLFWAERLSEIDNGPSPQHLSQLGNSDPFEYELNYSVNFKGGKTDQTALGFLTEADVEEIVRKQFGERFWRSTERWYW